MATIAPTRSDQRDESPDQRTLVGNEPDLTPAGYPRIPLNLRDHKMSIGITWSVLLLFNCVIPQALYFGLKYSSHTSKTVYLSVPTAIFGVTSIAAFIQRVYRLTKKDPFYRPLKNSPKSYLDFFQWNFLVGYIYIAAVIAAGDAVKSTRLTSMPLSLLIAVVCLQIVPIQFLVGRVPYPFRISSMVKGDMTRPALYTIIEDVVAVDGNEGLNFRRPFDQRYAASVHIRRLLDQLSWLWGLTGLAVSAADFALIWALKSEDAAWAIGWGAPFVWAGIMTWISFAMTKAALKKERSTHAKSLEAGTGSISN